MALDLRAVFRWSGRDFERGMDRSRAKVKELRAEMQRSVVGAAAGFFSVGAIASLTAKTIDYADKIDKMSQRIGVSRDMLQRFAVAAELSGSSLDMVERSIVGLSRRMTDVFERGAGKEFQVSLERLGVTMRDFQAMSPDQIFLKIGERVRTSTNTTQTLNDVTKVLGESAFELIPAFKAGFGEGVKQAEQLKLMSDSAIASAVTLKDQLTVMQHEMRGPLAELAKAGFTVLQGARFLHGATFGAAATMIGSRAGGASISESYGAAFREIGLALDRNAEALDRVYKAGKDTAEATKGVERELKKTL